MSDKTLAERMAKVNPGDWVKVNIGHGATAEGEARKDGDTLRLGSGVLRTQDYVPRGIVDLLEHKPAPTPEPTGLGAVVTARRHLDANLRKWTHIGSGVWGSEDGKCLNTWTNLVIVKVHSQGWSE